MYYLLCPVLRTVLRAGLRAIALRTGLRASPAADRAVPVAREPLTTGLRAFGLRATVFLTDALDAAADFRAAFLFFAFSAGVCDGMLSPF